MTLIDLHIIFFTLKNGINENAKKKKKKQNWTLILSHNFLGDDTKPSIEHWSNSFPNNALRMGIDQIPHLLNLLI